MQTQPIATAIKPRSLNPVLQRLLRTSHLLFQRRLVKEPVPLGVESAMPGLDVSESTWAEWEAAVAEQVA